MQSQQNSFSLSALGLAVAAALVLAGCASGAGGSAPTAEGGARAPAAAAPAPAPAPPPPPAEPGYDEITTALQGPLAAARKDLVGQTVLLDLQRASGRGVPAGSYVVEPGDKLFFRCLAAERGFRGGEVRAEVRAIRVAKSGSKTVDLARCAVAAEAAPAPAPTPAPRAAAPAPVEESAAGAGTLGAGKPGLDARGNVVDSSQVEAGSGRTVKGLNDYEGEITGNPAPGSKFARLQIGMSAFQVTNQIGPPSDQGAYMTGKAWIPFYFGADRHRFEMVYKGQGRLIFAGGAMGDFSNGYLIWIIHNRNEAGMR